MHYFTMITMKCNILSEILCLDYKYVIVIIVIIINGRNDQT